MTFEMDLMTSELVARKCRALEVMQNEAHAGAGDTGEERVLPA